MNFIKSRDAPEMVGGAFSLIRKETEINRIICQMQCRIGITDKTLNAGERNLLRQFTKVPVSNSIFLPIAANFIHRRCIYRAGKFLLQQINIPAVPYFISFFIYNTIANI